MPKTPPAPLAPLSPPLSAEEAGHLRWRGVEEPCRKCRGTGRFRYPSSATWRSAGRALARMTAGVCDGCWGSGDARLPWDDLRAREAAAGERAAARAATLFAERAGVAFEALRPGVLALAGMLDLTAARPRAGDEVGPCARALAALLREAVAAADAEDARLRPPG